MKKFLSILFCTTLLLSACQATQEIDSGNNESLNPVATTSSIVELADGASYDLEAGFVEKEINGSSYKMLAYNGSIPGPTLKVKQGSTITINFTNHTNIATTLHSHGIRLENAFDGVPGVTQKPIEPGENFAYTVRFDDAGVFWYHPHLREDYTQDMGLYGNYIVTPNTATDEWSPVNQEETLAVDDVLMQRGELAPYSMTEVTHALMGRFGNTMLVNGNTDYTLDLKKNEVVRFYVTNVANTRVFNLAIPGAKMKWIGSDNGLYEHEEWSDAILLGPSERAIVDVLFPESGNYNLEHQTPDKIYTLGKFTVADEELAESYVTDFNTLKIHQSVIASIDPYRAAFDRAPDKSLSIDLEMNGMGGMGRMNMGMGDGEPIEWEETMSMMNATSTKDTLTWKLIDEATKKTNEDIDDWNFKKGDVVKIQIVNSDDTTHPMQHPVHIHGQRFLVLSTDGKESENLVWKDTVLIPAGSTVELLVVMDNPGDWMVHCHIPEHLESGMMLPFKVSSI